VFINTEHRFIFLHIPKNAGTSIRNSFEIEGYDKKVVRKRYPHDSMSKVVNYCGEEKWKEYFTFAVKRNPYDRIVSYYHFYNSPQYRYPNNARDYSFDEWVKIKFDNKVGKTQVEYLDSHFNSDSELQIDYVAEYEDLENEWKIICKKIGIDHYELPIYNSSKHNDFRTYYTEETKDIVYEYFKEDFWYLGYHRND
tara:strand:+ start:316 stop:903 length:588 start_codon:yes stop_codon:yes gene_type:complete